MGKGVEIRVWQEQRGPGGDQQREAEEEGRARSQAPP